MTDVYADYIDHISTALASKDISNFKNSPRYIYILENVTEAQGHEYLQQIVSRFPAPKSDIIEYAKMNDQCGNPVKHRYLGTEMSPTSLRYFFHAMLILTYFRRKATTSFRLVEIGAGYGGLCLAINYCRKYFPDLKIDEYIMIDLPVPLKLQELYLSNFELSYPIKFLSAENFGADVEEKDQPLFLISNYCYSEISHEFQDKYQQNLLPKTKHGFLTWNTPLRGFGKALSIEQEYPKTGPHNLYVKY